MKKRILAGIVMLLMANHSSAESRWYSCDLMTIMNRRLESLHESGLPSYWLPVSVGRWPQFEKIDVPADSSVTDLERRYLQAVNLYIRASNSGSLSAIFHEVVHSLSKRLLVDQILMQERYLKRFKELERRNLFSSDIEQAFISLAQQRHKPSLRCLGHIYRYGIGVKVDRAKAWGFYDTYNLVAGIDGKDKFRASVSEIMTDLQIIEGQGLARIFRDRYTDAWKVPSMTILH